MTDSQITGGTVSYENGVKAAEEYAPAKKARAEIHFVVGEGEDAYSIMNQAQSMAFQAVDVFLGGNSKLPAALVQPAPAEAAKPPRVRRTQTQIAAAASAAASAASAATEGFDQPGEPSPDTSSASSGPEAGPQTDGAPTTGDAGGAQTSGDDWDAAPSTEVKDEDLASAATKTVARLVEAGADPDASKVRVRELIGTFNPDPLQRFQLTMIAQAQRPDFLAKLNDLK